MSRTALNPILDHLRGEPSRTWSIVITIYGDAIVPRGGCVWLGTLLAIFEGLGISGGVVRTAMSRLAADGWLERSRVGRNSFYRLADKGRETFHEATEHIYNQRPPRWRGHFEMVQSENGTDRELVRVAMEHAGFGVLAPGLWIAPAGTAVPKILSGALAFEARGDGAANRALAARSWPLAATGEAYRRFQSAFAPLDAALAAGTALSDLDALLARVLLIHEYRRIVLRDPILPAEILPEDWPGAEARRLCAAIYRRVLPASERWLDAHAVDESSRPLPPPRDIASRFAN